MLPSNEQSNAFPLSCGWSMMVNRVMTIARMYSTLFDDDVSSHRVASPFVTPPALSSHGDVPCPPGFWDFATASHEEEETSESPDYRVRLSPPERASDCLSLYPDPFFGRIDAASG